MTRKIVSFSVEHPVSVLSIVIALVFAGCFCAYTMNVDLLPVISCRKLVVATEYQGLSAYDMQKMITIPLEDSFSSLKGLKTITSVTRDGVSLVTLELHWGSDCDIALVECREIIDTCYQTLPSGCKKPVVTADTGTKDTVCVAVIPEDNDLLYGRHITEKDIKPRLQRVQGCAKVSVYGGQTEQVTIAVDQKSLLSTGLSIGDVAAEISDGNMEYPAGSIKDKGLEHLVKTSSVFKSVQDIRDFPVSLYDGRTMALSDFADIRYGAAEKESFFLYNGKECIKVGVTRKNDASPINLSRSIRKELKDLAFQYGDDFSFVITEDLSTVVLDSVLSLCLAAGMGIAVTFCVVFFFLKTWKSAILLSSVIPVCALVSVLVLCISGSTINMMSLSGIAIGIGMVVDCGAVVLENLNHLDSRKNNDEIISSVMSVAKSNTSSTVTTAVVFLPVFFLDGLLGELFFDMAVSIVCSIVTSCMLSLTYIPAVHKLTAFQNNLKTDSVFMQNAQNCYESVLQKILRNKILALIPAAACTILGMVVFPFMGFELLPRTSTSELDVILDFPFGTPMEQIEKETFDLSDFLLADDEVVSVCAQGGVEKDDFLRLAEPGQRKHSVLVTVNLTKTSRSTSSRLLDEIRKRHDDVYPVEDEGLLSNILDINNSVYVVTADNLDDLELNVSKTNASIITPNEKVKEIIFSPDRVISSRLSANPSYVASVVYGNLEGIEASPFYLQGRQVPILVRMADAEQATKEDVENMGIPVENTNIPLRLLGKLEAKENDKTLYRYNRKDSKLIQADENTSFGGLPLTNVVSLEKVELSQMLSNGLVLLAVALVLLYLVMGAQFQSFSIPFLLLVTIPPSFSGGMVCLAITGYPLSIYGVIALVVLFGTSVNNSILLFEGCFSSGIATTDESILYGCKKKLRAVLVTNISTIFALLPFTIDPMRKNSQTSMSVCITGGLIFSLVLVLVVMPPLFSILLRKRRKG